MLLIAPAALADVLPPHGAMCAGKQRDDFCYAIKGMFATEPGHCVPNPILDLEPDVPLVCERLTRRESKALEVDEGVRRGCSIGAGQVFWPAWLLLFGTVVFARRRRS